MTKVEINGKTYCVETLIYTVERLTKDVKASAEYHRLMIDKIRAEINNKSNEPNYLHKDEDWSVGLEMALEIIDKYIVKSKKKSNCSTCANANNVVVCPYTIKDIAAEEGCKFWHEPKRSDEE